MSFESTLPFITDNGRRQNNNTDIGYRGYCQWYGTQGHRAKRCPQLQSCSQTQSMLNSTSHDSSTASPTWLLDSGASRHVTSNVTNLSSVSTYDGHYEIIIGNGSGLDITHVRFILTPCFFLKILYPI